MVLRFFLLAVAFLLSCTEISRDNPLDEKSSHYGESHYENTNEVGFEFTDPRDKKVYDAVEFTTTEFFYNRDGETIKEEPISKIAWMAQNLSYNASGSVCYNSDPDNCTKYGRLYDFETAKVACPDGWRLPSWEEVENFEYRLTKLLGYEDCYKYEFDSTAGVYNCKNRWLGLGGLGYSNDNFSDLDTIGYWWTSTEFKAGNVYSLRGQMDKRGSRELEKEGMYGSGFLSIRCVTTSAEVSSSNSKPSSSSSYNRASVVNGSPVTYGGETYETVVIGFQTWMARNLNYYANGKCPYNDPANCAKYGKLYNWATAMNLPSSCNSTSCASQVSAMHQGICPSGWHIPSEEDWETLIKATGGSSHLMAIGDGRFGSGWWFGKDTYGFSALSVGYCYLYVYGELECTDGNNGFWWLSNEANNNSAHFRYIGTSTISEDSKDKESFLSVRCIKDDPSLVKPSSSSSKPSSSSAVASSSSSTPSEGFCVVYDNYEDDVYCITNISPKECESYFNDDDYDEDYSVFQDSCPSGSMIDWDDY